MSVTTGEQVTDKIAIQIQYLRDCGCKKEVIDRFFDYAETNQIQDQIRLMMRQRVLVMDQLHSNQQKVDRIDYIIGELEEQKKKLIQNNK